MVATDEFKRAVVVSTCFRSTCPLIVLGRESAAVPTLGAPTTRRMMASPHSVLRPVFDRVANNIEDLVLWTGPLATAGFSLQHNLQVLSVHPAASSHWLDDPRFHLLIPGNTGLGYENHTDPDH